MLRGGIVGALAIVVGTGVLGAAAIGCSCERTPGSIDAAVDASDPLDSGPPDAPPRDAPPRDAPPPDNTCASVRVGTLRQTPNVMLVIDQSGSMIDELDGARSKWATLRDALIRTPDGLVYELRSQVRFGAAMFMDDPDIAGCPDLQRTPAVIDGWEEVASLYTVTSPGGNTPTGDAIASVLAELDTLVPDRASDPTVLVLATDGDPATCADGTDIVGGRASVVEQVATAHAMGIDTYVLSVGFGGSAPHLQEVANAGLGVAPGEPDAPYWVATDASGLESALRAIVGGVLSCQLELEGEIEPAFACGGSVTLGGDALECGTDWRALDGTHIEILGDACDRLQTGALELVASFPCDVLI